MPFFDKIEINLFLSVILIIIILVTYEKRGQSSVSSKIFAYLCWSTLVVLFFDSCCWASNGIPGKNNKWIPYVSNYAFFFTQPIPLVIWLFYIDFLLHKSIQRLRTLWYLCVPVIFGFGLLIYSYFTDFIFYIDENNFYHRGPGMFLMAFVYMILLLSSFLPAIRNREDSDKKIIGAILLFCIIPLIGFYFQIKFSAGPHFWPSVAVSITCVYIFLQTQREIRDYLTGLLNRQQIDDIIQFRIDEYSKKGCFGLIMIDMDGFKEINDLYGHNQGDEALVQMSSILTGQTRNRDSVARFGGDEFIILVETDSEDEIVKIINRIQDKIESINRRNKKPYILAASAGYSIYHPNVYRSFLDLLIDVDKKMYAVKNVRKMELQNLIR